jgi:hypothetical protein
MATPNPSDDASRIREQVTRELQLVFSDFYKGSAKEKLYRRNTERFAQQMLKLGKTVSLLCKYPLISVIVLEDLRKYAGAPTDEVRAKLEAFQQVSHILNAFSYVAFVEAVATPFIDMSILLLSAEGFHFHVEPDREHIFIRHAMSLEDLESPSISLGAKLNFLESCGITFFSKWIDKTLRNKIAHLDFEIEGNGDFVTTTSKENVVKKVKIDLLKKLNSFVNYNTAVSDVFTKTLGKAYPTSDTSSK